MWEYYATLLEREQYRTKTVSQSCSKTPFPVQQNSIP